MAKFKIEGMDELNRSIKRLGKLPQKIVTKAARSGASIALKSARQKAPIDTGMLRKGIILKGEKRTRYGKKVYQVTMDHRMNAIFQKQTATGMRRRRRGTKVKYEEGNYYYPASQEFGFVTRNGGYAPGFNFLRDSLVDNKSAIERKVVTILAKEVDKALKG